MYVHTEGERILILVLYLDNPILIDSNEVDLDRLKQRLRSSLDQAIGMGKAFGGVVRCE